MTDLHTHILPGMDDGAKTVEQSLQMLQMQLEQCVDTVVLTPHFYRERETVEEFLSRRGKAMAQLTAALPANAPQLLLGADGEIREPGWARSQVWQYRRNMIKAPETMRTSVEANAILLCSERDLTHLNFWAL